MANLRKLFGVAAVALAGAAIGLGVASAEDSTVVVTPNDMATSIADVTADPTSWFFYNDENDTIDNSLGSFVTGPETPPLGNGSVQISVSGTQRRNLATYQFSGTPLADITELKYSTYNPSAGNGGSANRSAYLQFNADFDGSDTWQRRLVFLPSDNGTILQNEWQEWDTLAEGDALWRYSGPTWPGTSITGATPRTWNDILTSYLGVRIRVTDSWLGMRVGEPYPDGYTENIDAFVFGTAAGIQTFDFEPCFTVETSKGTLTAAKVAESDEQITGDIDAHGCEIGIYIPVDAENVTISADVHNANQYGIFNNGNVVVSGAQVYEIGNHTGGVFAPNGNQTGVGIYFFVASGSVTDSDVHSYQKGGIVINGDSQASVTGNEVTGLDTVPFIAQNGIQFGYGATGEVKGNEVDSNWFSGADWASTGILLFETDDVTVQGNLVVDSQVGISMETWCWVEPTASNNRVINNAVLNADWGISIAAYDFPGFSTCDASADNNKVTNNIVESEDGVEGIFVGTAQLGSSFEPSASNNKVVNNDVSGFETGISQSGDSSSKVHANVID